MKKTLFVISILSLLGLGTYALVWSHGYGHMMGGGMGGGMRGGMRGGGMMGSGMMSDYRPGYTNTVKYSIKNVKNGISISMISDDVNEIKKIQERGELMKKFHATDTD